MKKAVQTLRHLLSFRIFGAALALADAARGAGFAGERFSLYAAALCGDLVHNGDENAER